MLECRVADGTVRQSEYFGDRCEHCCDVYCVEACWVLNIQLLAVLQELYPVGPVNTADKFC